MPNEETVLIEDARILFRNFEGKEGPYNREGDRSFCVILPAVLVQPMIEDGWNVKHTKVREEGDVGEPYVKVNISYKGRPPKIVLITSRGRNDLDESAVSLLDWVDINKADLIIRPYNWVKGRDSGISGYLKTMFITINEDYLERKYAGGDGPGHMEVDE